LILLDTSGLLAALVGNQRSHEAAKAALERTGGPFVLSPFVVAELDYLLGREAGLEARLALLGEVAAGAYELVSASASPTPRSSCLPVAWAPSASSHWTSATSAL
jgi:predicted nucleic acid-binding protein